MPHNKITSFNNGQHTSDNEPLLRSIIPPISTSSDNPNINNSATKGSKWKGPSFVPADKLGVFFDNDENDEALFAQLKLERKLYRNLSAADSPQDLAIRIAGIIKSWGFSDYVLMRLDSVEKDSGTTALTPTALLSSYGCEDSCTSGMILHATADDAKTRHLSMLHHYIASMPADSLRHPSGRYLLIVNTGKEDCYITPSGLHTHSRYMSLSSLSNDSNEQDARQHLLDNQHAIDVMSNTIEGIGIAKFPYFFKRAKTTKTNKINPRPLRLINTLALHDATLREAAEILHLSTDTINKHIAAAKAALGTKTIAGTVWRAVQEGLIDENI